LAYYIVIAIASAIINTRGTSIIFQAQATPGGFDVISSHIASRKKDNKVLKFFMKFLGVFVIFSITIINFFFVEENYRMKKSLIEKELFESGEDFEEKNLEDYLEEWKNDLDLANKKEEESEIKDQDVLIKKQLLKDCFELRNKNRSLTSVIASKIKKDSNFLLKYPIELDYFLSKDDNERKLKIKDEILTIEEKIKKEPEITPLLERKWELGERIKKERSNLLVSYFRYVTNDEKL
jgi:uncharacterized membrane-anchored protein YitT (DUF2179 family)